MTEVELIGPWLDDIDPLDTRERMLIYSGAHSGHTFTKLDEDGTISYLGEFVPNVLTPEKASTESYGATLGQAGAGLNNRRWFSTPGAFPFFDYDSFMLSTGSLAHAHDYDPRAWMTATAAALKAAKAAELDTDPGNVVVDWELPPGGLFGGQIGTYSARELEVWHTVAFAEQYDRAGDVAGFDTGVPNSDQPDPLGVYAYPLTSPGDVDPDTAEYQVSGPLEVVPGAWKSSVLEDRAHAGSFSDAGTEADLIGTVDAGGDGGGYSLLDIQDWWVDNAWPVTGAVTDYLSLGAPLRMAYDFMFTSADSGTCGDNEHKAFESHAEVYMRSVWAPPRHRFRVFVERTGIPPRRIFQRSDASTHGARSAFRSRNTVQAGNRTIGGIL